MPSGRRLALDAVARLQRVFIDTSELFPFTIMDALLTLSEDFIFSWVWTDEVLEEWEKVIVREGLRSVESARSVSDAVRAHFSEYRIDPILYRGRATPNLSPDPDDRLHAAACVYGDVDILLTRNHREFAAPAIGQAGVQVMSSDEFLCGRLSHRRRSVIESISRTANRKLSPPISPIELANVMANAGTPKFAARLKALLPE